MIIKGNTYPVRRQLAALGGRWNPTARGWDVPDSRAAEARKLVDAQPVRPRYRMECADCGEYVDSGTRCWETGLIHFMGQ